MQNTSHAVMAQRAELKNSLDDFPTPPWATRALIEHVVVRLWHQVIELKAKTFSEEELRHVIDYEKWSINTRCENVLQVHSVGIGYDFAEEVIAFVQNRKKYKDRPIRLIRYQYEATTGRLKLEPVE